MAGTKLHITDSVNHLHTICGFTRRSGSGTREKVPDFVPSKKYCNMAMSDVTTNLIIEKSLHNILLSRIPNIKLDLNCTDEKSCAFKVAAFFATYTKHQIKSGSQSELAKCFQVADEIIRLSSNDSKQAIESVFLFALSKYIQADREVFKLLPSHLKKMYQKSHSARGK